MNKLQNFCNYTTIGCRTKKITFINRSIYVCDLIALVYTVLELEVRLATEEEEKKLLQARLDELREQARQQQDQLKAELEKVNDVNAQIRYLLIKCVLNSLLQWTDKAKKKQDRFV